MFLWHVRSSPTEKNNTKNLTGSLSGKILSFTQNRNENAPLKCFK